MILKFISNLHDNDDPKFHFKWVKHVQSALNDIGMFDSWSSQSLDASHFIGTYKQRRLRKFRLQWEDELSKKSDCLFYRCIKQNPFKEKYLRVKEYNTSHILAKLRTGAHHLPCTRNRFEPTGSQERLICDLCLDGTGDEAHYLFHCPVFSLERLNMIPEILICNNENYLPNLKKIFEEADTELMIRLARFVKIVFRKFQYKGKSKGINSQPPDSPTYEPVQFTNRGRKVKIPQRLNL